MQAAVDTLLGVLSNDICSDIVETIKEGEITAVLRSNIK